MGIDVQKFIAELPEREKGKLVAWESAIFELLAARVTYGAVVEFLSQNGVKANRMEVHSFVHRKKRRHLLDALPAKGHDRTAGQISRSAQGGQATPASALQEGANDVPEDKAGRQHELPKFDWQALKNETKNSKW